MHSWHSARINWHIRKINTHFIVDMIGAVEMRSSPSLLRFIFIFMYAVCFYHFCFVLLTLCKCKNKRWFLFFFFLHTLLIANAVQWQWQWQQYVVIASVVCINWHDVWHETSKVYYYWRKRTRRCAHWEWCAFTAPYHVLPTTWTTNTVII